MPANGTTSPPPAHPAPAPDAAMVTVQIMGKTHRVPEGLTVLQALWHTGHDLIRGVGCLGGVCGACATVYRTRGDFALRSGLGCQLTVEDGMGFQLAPDYPAPRPSYEIEALTAPQDELFTHFPEALNCRNCNACNVICPQDIDIKGAVRDAVKGDFESAADKALSCVMCGLCVSRCIAEMAPNLIALYARRNWGASLAPKRERLDGRIAQIEAGQWDPEWDTIASLDPAGLREFCQSQRAADTE